MTVRGAASRFGREARYRSNPCPASGKTDSQSPGRGRPRGTNPSGEKARRSSADRPSSDPMADSIAVTVGGVKGPGRNSQQASQTPSRSKPRCLTAFQAMPRLSHPDASDCLTRSEFAPPLSRPSQTRARAQAARLAGGNPAAAAPPVRLSRFPRCRARSGRDGEPPDPFPVYPRNRPVRRSLRPGRPARPEPGYPRGTGLAESRPARVADGRAPEAEDQGGEDPGLIGKSGSSGESVLPWSHC